MGMWSPMIDRAINGTLRKEDNWPDYPKPSTRELIIIDDEKRLLSEKQTQLLQDCASLDFSLGRYKSIADILNALKIPVYIREGVIESDHKDFFDEMIKEWGDKLPMIKNYISITSSRLRGRYLPKEKIIELFPEEMEAEAKCSDGRVDGATVMNLLITTLAHETMHAYFDRPGHAKYPYAYFVEEPLAEFGMLVYLKETDMPEIVIDWAHDDVADKHSCYSYGAKLFDLPEKEYNSVRNYLKVYKVAEIGKYDVLVADDKTVKIWHSPVSGSPLMVTIPGGTAAVRASISGVGISSKRFYFEAKSCWRGTGTELYFTIKNNIASDPCFAKGYKKGDTVNISFHDKTGVKRISGTASIVSQHRIRTSAQLTRDYACNFGVSDHRLFGFFEDNPAVDSSPAEWIAEEIYRL